MVQELVCLAVSLNLVKIFGENAEIFIILNAIAMMVPLFWFSPGRYTSNLQHSVFSKMVIGL